ncbi:hypothetical protein SEA_FUZZBUSTER_1 [Microbacterium phage FuzzBuster]|uniref:Uncharacterized protein n=1 Tax=Microbacterium phage FuzzBuster TaxID=2590935 RepID=A0A516KUX3_9CAUD|nr:hypothetical protein SEA_FUZZBUSTER_1 [Microbacterium phage FuzzBuster]
MTTAAPTRIDILRAAQVGDTIPVEVINRVDPLYGQTLDATVTKITGPSNFGITEIWWEVEGAVDHMGTPRLGAEAVRL